MTLARMRVPHCKHSCTITLSRRLPDAERLAWADQLLAKMKGRRPKNRPEVYADQLADAKPGFEIAVNVAMKITDDESGIEEALYGTRASLGFYIGGMGAKGQNYHTKLMARMGYEEEAYRIQDLFFEGRRDEAIAAVPTEFADEISLVGSPERIRDRLEAWRESPVTMNNVAARSGEELRVLADLVKG